MTVSLRNQRARVYGYANAGTGGPGTGLPGRMKSTYRVIDSGDADQAWWARVEEPGGKEITIGEIAEHQSPAVIAFSAVALTVPLNSVVLLLNPDGTAGPLYRTSSVNPRRLLRETAVEAVFADKSLYTLVD